MTLLTAAEVYRDHVTDGVPATGANEPEKAEIRALLGRMSDDIAASVATTALVYQGRTALLANVVPGENARAEVRGDATAGYNGIYRKFGATGIGTWVRAADLPDDVVVLTITGGTANNIIATATPQLPAVPGNKIFILRTIGQNTTAVTLTVDTNAAAPVKSLHGVSLVSGALSGDTYYMLFWSVDSFRLVLPSDVEADAILAEVLGALADTEAARDIAVAAAGDTRSYATLAALAAAAGPAAAARVYVEEVDAHYAFTPASATTIDGWGVIGVTGGTAGRWKLASDRIVVPARGSALTDTARLTAADAAMSAIGRKIQLKGETYTLATTWARPTTATHLIMDSKTVLNATFASDGQPQTAALYAGPGSLLAGTTVAAVNGVSSYTVSVLADVATPGQYIRIRDTSSGSGFRGSSYLLRSVSGSGPYTLTLDRPVRIQYGIGDAVDVFDHVGGPHIIEGNGAKITGGGTRSFEYILCWRCRIYDLRFEPTGVDDIIASFDIGGFDNKFIRCHADGNGAALDGFALETQESSSIEECVAHHVTGRGIVMFDSIDCKDSSKSFHNGFGAVITGDGNTTGCVDCELNGTYLSNTVHGISVLNGSTNTRIDAVSRFNPINLRISDAGVGITLGVFVTGVFSNATDKGIEVTAASHRNNLVNIDTSGCPYGVYASSIVNIVGMKHHDTASNAMIYNNATQVMVSNLEGIVTGATNAVRTFGAGRTSVVQARVEAGAGSNILYGDNLSVTVARDVVAVGGAGTTGAYADTGATMYVNSRDNNFAGVTTPTGGGGTIS